MHVRLLQIYYLGLTEDTAVDDGQNWPTMTFTVNEMEGATDYYYIPLSCNYGTVTGVSVDGRTISCTATNISGERHACVVNGLVIIIQKKW